jgi:chorismate synthase
MLASLYRAGHSDFTHAVRYVHTHTRIRALLRARFV